MHRKGKLSYGYTSLLQQRAFIKMEKVFIFWFQLNSNMLDISFAMGMFSYENCSKCKVETPIFDVFQ